jgi:membrane peptidoglycan carboxypeptidase
VRDADGKVLYKARPTDKRAVSSDIAHDVTRALTSVVDEGTGRAVRSLNRPIAGKTGTKDRKNDIVSSWFVGYTKQISTAVMYVAGNGGNDDLDPYARPGDSTFFGGTYPALTWADYMQVATKGQPVKDFPDPAYVNSDGPPQPTVQSAPTTQPTHSAEPSHTTKPTPTPTATKTATSKPTDQPSTAPATTKPPTTAPATTQSTTRRPGPTPSRQPPGGAASGQGPGPTPRGNR